MNKKIIIVLVALTMLACKKERVPYVTLSGKITNPNSKTLAIENRQNGFKKVITIDENGVFKDTFNIAGKGNNFIAFDGKEYTQLFLENGDNINITLDAKKFDETIKFTGDGAEESTFLSKVALTQEEFYSPDFLNGTKEEFSKKVTDIKTELLSLLDNKNMDSAFVANNKNGLKQLDAFANQMFENNQYMKNVLAKGKPSPQFNAYENYNGGETSLSDLKGKYVYIDLWATWCQPCKQEIPFLKEIEKQYHGKNIEFVSISVDRVADHDVWKKMVKDMQLTGVQLYAKGDEKFMNDYRVTGIPRFILLDKEGKIISPNAPRPSSKAQLTTLLNSLDL